MNHVSPLTSSTVTASESARTDKLVRAAHQFEAVLLNSLLSSLEQSFSALAGEKTESGSDNYHYLGLQTLTSSLAGKGGVGIADLIVRHLRESESPRADSASIKNPSKSSSLERLLKT
jgi:Rod binding domain-containing protein